MARSGVERRLGIGDEPETDTVLTELLLEDDACFLDIARGNTKSVGTDTERDFAVVRLPGVEVGSHDLHACSAPVARQFGHDATGFLTTTETLKIKVGRCDERRAVRKPTHSVPPVETLQFSHTESGLSAQNCDVHSASIYHLYFLYASAAWHHSEDAIMSYR